MSAEKIAALDLVLVAPRHLFRMPYSLHEKTALASIVLDRISLASFSPRDADPMTVRMGEIFFRPQKISVIEDSIVMGADDEVVTRHGQAGETGNIMDLLAAVPLTLSLSKATFAAGTTSTYSTTGTTVYAIKGKAYSTAAKSNVATPTVDIATGAAFKIGRASCRERVSSPV